MICVVTLGPMAEMHCPVAGLVSHKKTLSGKEALPVSADAVMVPFTPTFTVATAKAPVPFVPGIFTMPSLVAVAAKATISGTGVADAENKSVFKPTLTGAGLVFAQAKLNCTSVGAIGAVGVSAITKLCAAPVPTLIGVLGVPITWLVVESVVW